MELRSIYGSIIELIAEAVRNAAAREETEKAQGKILRNDPVARLICPPVDRGKQLTIEYFLNDGCYVAYQDQMIFEQGGRALPYVVFTDTTRYLESRRMWSAYKPALQLLREGGIEDEAALYPVFHYVPGVMIFVENHGKILIGIRSSSLAGTHAGMISFPAGLVNPQEQFTRAAERELGQESGLYNRVKWGKVFVPIRNPDAPSTTFCVRAETTQSKVRETFEVKGKKFIWVSVVDVLHPALAHDMKPMVAAFRTQGIDIPDEVKIAPDAYAGLKIFGYGDYDT